MADINFLERQALERATLINKNTYNSRESVKPEKIRQRVTSMPVELPEGYSYPNFQSVFQRETEKPIKRIDRKESRNGRNTLNELLHDPEAALLTGLIMLLKSEGADEMLLAALGYILL